MSTSPAPVGTVTPVRVSPVRLTSTARSSAVSVKSGMPTRASDSRVPLAARREAAWVCSAWSVVDRISTPSSPPVAFTPSSSAVSWPTPMNASVSVPPIDSVVSTTSSMPSAPATPPGPITSMPLPVSTFSMANVPSTETKPSTSRVAVPLARVTSAGSAKPMSTVDVPVATVAPARVSPVPLISTARPSTCMVTPSIPTTPIDSSVPFAARRAAACVVCVWSVVDRIRTPISPPVAFTPSS